MVEPSEVIYLNLEQFRLYFDHEQIEKLTSQNYIYNENEVKRQINQILANKKYVNRVVHSAAFMNLQDSKQSGDGGEQAITALARENKRKRLGAWIDKSAN